MKRSVPLLFSLAVLLASGCTKAAPPPASRVQVRSESSPADHVKPALDLLRQAKEVGQIHDALHLLNAHLSGDQAQQVTAVSDQDREALQKLFRLDRDETAEMTANLFRPADAYHLQSSFLFRDASRHLEIPNLAPLEQARLCFAWVMRRVQLHEQADEGLPPAFVLRRGFGSARDRAVVFLALLRQLQIDGCLVAETGPPAEPATPVLAGVLLTREEKPALFLFDPRLEEPVAGPAKKGIATLAEVRAHAELLKRSALAEKAALLDVYQVSSLETLPARMRYLQELLAFQDKVILFHDALRLDGALSKVAGGQAKVWNAVASLPGRPTLAPSRALREFLPPEEGGTDRLGRQRRFLIQQVPWPALARQFQEMHIFSPHEIPEQARENLFRFANELFTTFALEPRESFLHGQFDASLKRLDRMRGVLETEEAAKPLDEAALQKKVSEWRDRVNAAYIAYLVRGDSDGPARVHALWNEDQFLLNLRKVDSEIPLQTYEKKLLSLILLHACRQPISQQLSYLVAACLHEKAAQLQANQDFLAAGGHDITVIKENAGYAWRNARGAWNKYLDLFQLNGQNLPRRLEEITQHWEGGNLDAAVSLWEQLHQDLHTTLEARLRLAEAQKQIQSTSPAMQELMAELAALQKSDCASRLANCLEKARNAPAVIQRLELLSRDWALHGNLYWLRAALSQRGEAE